MHSDIPRIPKITSIIALIWDMTELNNKSGTNIIYPTCMNYFGLVKGTNERPVE